MIRDSKESFIEKVEKIHPNKYSFDKTNYITSRIPIIITCKKHNYDFQVIPTVVNHLKKKHNNNSKVGSCPLCLEEYSNKIRLKYIEDLKKKHNNEYEYKNYVNNKIPFIAICKKHGEFNVVGRSHIKGSHKCPKCYVNNNSKIIKVNEIRYYACSIHGNVKIGKKRKNNQGCPVCNLISNNNRLLNVNKNNIFNKLNKDYIVNFIVNDKVELKCRKHNTLEIYDRKLLTSKIKDNVYFCSKCRLENTITYDEETLIDMVKNAININYNNFYEYIQIIYKGGSYKSKVILLNKLNGKEKIVFVNSILNNKLSVDKRYVSRDYMSFIDAKNYISNLGIRSYREYKKWFIRTKQNKLPTNPQRYYKEWISYTDFFNTENKKSMGEIRIENYLINKKYDYITQKRFEKCKYKKVLPFDFYLPKYNVIIEFDGIQHFKPCNKFGLKSYESTVRNDNIKNDFCKKNNIYLIRVTYDDLENNILEWSLDIELDKIIAEQAVLSFK